MNTHTSTYDRVSRMRKRLYALKCRCPLSAIVLMLAASGHAPVVSQEEPERGFIDVKFGETRDAFVEKIKTRYQMKRSFPITEWPMNGSGMDFLMTRENVLCLTDYQLGKRTYTALFYFNSFGRFYGFRFKGDISSQITATKDLDQKRGASGLTFAEATEMLRDVRFLAGVFETKYCPPTKSFDFTAEQLMENAERIFWLQDTERYLAVAGTICIA